jgi:nuclease-like protein
MPALNSRVWQRYGQLRIYISAGDEAVGWFDPRSGRSQLSQPDRCDEFWAIVRSECQRLLQHGTITEAEAGTPPDAPVSAPSVTNEHWVVRDPEWDDLADNEPGASASARARELRREHPLLTRTARLLGIRTSAQTFAAGARGEQTVGRQLNKWAARYGWHVLHAVPVGQRGADIDHVVIGPFGVVTVNTKTTGTAVWVGEYGLTLGGKPVDYLRQSRREAARAGRLLSRATGQDVPVQPAIVFVRAPRVTIRRGGPADVAVLASPRSLGHWLRRQRPVLPLDQVEAIYQAARRPASWQRGDA